MLDKIGARVLPDFPAWWMIQPQRRRAKTVVVENGMLETLLTSRALVRRVLQSTGNMRGGRVAPSNLLLTASKSSSLEELKKQLLELVIGHPGFAKQ